MDPRFSSTPTTVIGSPLMFSVLPIGSRPAKNFSLTVHTDNANHRRVIDLLVHQEPAFNDRLVFDLS
jgi:hypothetical protein